MTQNVSRDVQGWAKPELVHLGAIGDVAAMLVPAAGQCNAKGQCKS